METVTYLKFVLFSLGEEKTFNLLKAFMLFSSPSAFNNYFKINRLVDA